MFARNNALDAYNPYQNGITPALPKADDDYKQYGGSIGGRIIKDKLFYFSSYEGMRFTVGAPSLINTPTSSPNAQTPDDSLPLAIKGLIANGVTPSPLSLNLAGCTVAAGAASCNPAKGIFPNGATVTENIPVALNNVGSSNNVIGKIDYHISLATPTQIIPQPARRRGGSTGITAARKWPGAFGSILRIPL